MRLFYFLLKNINCICNKIYELKGANDLHGSSHRLKAVGGAYDKRKDLFYKIEMLLKAKDKHHQAEKPIFLYEYLINLFTEEKDILLDTYGGSCNLLKAATNLNRFAIFMR